MYGSTPTVEDLSGKGRRVVDGRCRPSGSFAALRMTARTSNGNGNGNRNSNGNSNSKGKAKAKAKAKQGNGRANATVVAENMFGRSGFLRLLLGVRE
jgi:hypothetical protein